MRSAITTTPSGPTRVGSRAGGRVRRRVADAGIPLRPSALLAAWASLTAPVVAQSLALELVVDGLSQPVHLTSPPGDARLFVCENGGLVKVVEHGVTRATPFLDLRAEVHPNEGLASLVFHPRFPAEPYAFVSYLDQQVRGRLVRYTLSSDPNRLDAASAVDVLPPEPEPSALHNFGAVTFGPDGRLYLATGDGNLPNDNAPDHARDLGSILGKVLRLDIDAPPPHIPPDNPFVGLPGARGEVLCFGLRNPWRMSFDRATGDLWIGDVGRADREEVDVVSFAAAFGADFGWRCREGTHCTTYAPCATGCAPTGRIDPLVEYPHTDGRCAVIGGHVYRGAAIPWLTGRYVYGDFCTGEVRTLLHRTNEALEHAAFLPRTAHWQRPVLLASFGEDTFGELYLLDLGASRVFRLVDGCGATQVTCASTSNSTGRPAALVARGSFNVGDDALTLFAHPVPAGSVGYFLTSRTEVFVPHFGGSLGNLCVGPTILRFSAAPQVAGASGEVTFELPLTDFGGGVVPQPGDTWHFQYWFRDFAPGPTSNTSHALRIELCP
ncbi:MAG: PQQ-dependent sugar dehydrogenase [Planctomycetota bacterium]